MRDHQHFVQGVAWDPLGNFIVTTSADRSVKIWQCSFKLNGALVVTPCNKLTKLPGMSGEYPIFFDESLVSFFRRPSFSPDGSLLFLPCGLYQNSVASVAAGSEEASGTETENCLYVCAYASLHSTPVLAIRGVEKPILGIRCNPRLFQLRQQQATEAHLFSLQYRIVYAVFTLDTVMVFDTTCTTPFCHIRDLHYGSLTDACWSPDGSTLFVSSTDGFCSVLTFSVDELGLSLSADDQSNVLSGLRQNYGIKMPKKPPSMEFTPVATMQAALEDSFMAPSSDPIAVDREGDEIPMTAIISNNTEVECATIITKNVVEAIPSSINTNSDPPKRRIQPTLISQ